MQPTTSASAETAARPPRHLSRCFTAALVLIWVAVSAPVGHAQPAGGNVAPPNAPPAAPANNPAAQPATDPAGVPEGFQAPKAPPAVFNIEKELITADEVTALQKKLGVRYRTQLRSADMPPELFDGIEVRVGVPWNSICAEATSLGVDLIVIGSHGYGALDRLLGTTAAKVVNHADRSVLVVR